MNNEAFQRLQQATFKRIEQLGVSKGGEYSGDFDRLANFKRNAAALGLRPEQIWAVYAAKHWDAVMQYVHDLQTGINRPREESIEGRADDLILYLILFKAILRERIMNATPEAEAAQAAHEGTARGQRSLGSEGGLAQPHGIQHSVSDASPTREAHRGPNTHSAAGAKACCDISVRGTHASWCALYNFDGTPR